MRRAWWRRDGVSLALALVAFAASGCGAGDAGRPASLPETAEAAGGGAAVGPEGAASRVQRPRRYDCRRDTALMLAAPVAAADTVGLGEAVAAAFPGWRPSTLREMACRFPLTDGSRPEDFWPDDWDSGRVWWSWNGDFDGDGAPDRLLVLTSAADPSQDQLGVLFGGGRSAVVAPLGGWGVEIRPAARWCRT